MSKFDKFAHYFIMVSLCLAAIVTFGLAIFSGNREQFYNYLQPIILLVFYIFLFLFTEKFYKSNFDNLPTTYYYIAAIFVFCSNILGELYNFYERFWWWDNALHFASGILIGLTSIMLCNYFLTTLFAHHDELNDLKFLIIISVLASISVAVFWELFEVSMDLLDFGMNMQKGIIVNPADPQLSEFTPYISEKSGRFFDPGLMDTMNDQFLATIGALLVGFYSYFTMKRNLDLPDKNSNLVETKVD